MKKEAGIYISFSLLFLLITAFVFYFQHLIAEREEERFILKKESAHNNAITQFESSIENFATVVSGLKAHIDNSDEIPSVQQLQAFTNNLLDNLNFHDSIIISYLDTTHTFIFSFDRTSINKNNLVGVDLTALRDQKEIDFLNEVMKDDKLHLTRPFNLVEGWLGIPIDFNVVKNGISVGYIAPLINFGTVINAVYNNPEHEDFIYQFKTNEGIDFDRTSIHDGSKIYTNEVDSLYYKRFSTSDPFLTSTVSIFGMEFVIGTAYRNHEQFAENRTRGSLTWIPLTGTILFFIAYQTIKNKRLSTSINVSKDRITQQNIVLEKKQNEFTNLLENMGDGVFELDGSGKVLYINSTMLEMLNITKEEIFRTSIWEMIYPEDVQAMKRFYIEKFREQETNCFYEFRLRPKGLDTIWIEQNTTMLYEDGRMIKLRSIARNLTENIRLKKELTYQESLFKLVTDNASDLIALHGPDTSFKFASPSSFALLGYKPSELIGKQIFTFVHKEDLAKLEKAQLRILSGEKLDKLENRMVKKDGSIIWIESHLNPIFNDLGELDSVQVSSRDITQKRKERELLEIAKSNAEKATRAKANFLSMMSHEIRTPLNGIIGITHLLLAKEPKSSQLNHLGILKQSGENLLAIVNDILDFNKIEEGKIELNNTDFNLLTLAKSIHKNYQLQAHEKGLNVTLNSKELAETYTGDALRISQVLHNLMSNAIKFTENGNVSLRITKTDQVDDYEKLLFEVEDTGIGISNKMHKNIFDLFIQEEKSTSSKYGGSGLGLTISKRLLELMESDLEVESAQGKGSKFYFSLVLPSKATTTNVSNDLELAEYPTLKGNVLVVEDNAFNLSIVTDFLESWGCTVSTAKNGKEALKLLTPNSFQMILMDLQMPVMDGFEAVKRIRNKDHQYYKDVPVFALTADMMSATKEKVFEGGMDEIVSKPFIPLDLYSKIATYLSTSIFNNDADIGSRVLKKLEETVGSKADSVRYLNLFIETINEEIDFLSKALTAEDLNLLKEYAHKNKSSFKLAGLEVTAQVAEEIETMILRKSPTKMILNKAHLHYEEVKGIITQLSTTYE